MTDAFSRTALLVGDEGLARLQSASIAVIGVGGVGSYAAEAMARAGVGRLTLVDGDIVHASNINRQLHALQTTVGIPKVTVMAERLRQINQDLVVTTAHRQLRPEDIPDLLSDDFDLVLDAIDTFESKVALLQYCVKQGVAVISSMGAAGKLDPARVRVADLAESHGCRLARKLRKQLRRNGVATGVSVVFSDEPFAEKGSHTEPEPGDARRPLGSISYLPAIFGLQMASAAIRYVLAGQLQKKCSGRL